MTVQRTRARHSARPGFTLVELLVVILILAILIALLVPAISGAVKAARDAQVNAEIANLNTALASFKSQFGDYPPSRILLSEDNVASRPTDGSVLDIGDISYAALRSRSLKYLRKFFPRVQWGSGTPGVYLQGFDFNGDGVLTQVPSRPNQNTNPARGDLILDGAECLVFFLGGMPRASNGSIATIGFAKNPLAPFDLNSTNRIQPSYEFKSSQLFVMPRTLSGMPSYLDPFSGTTAEDQRPYAYFYSYGANGYDPNDVNYVEALDETSSIIAISQIFKTSAGINTSRAPNPYSSNEPVAYDSSGNITNAPANFFNPEGFQIITSGRDRLWGIGGKWDEKGTNRLPLANAAKLNVTDAIRQREADNLTNFAGGKLD